MSTIPPATRALQLALNEFNAGVTRARRAYDEDMAPPEPTSGDCADCHNTHVLQSRGLCSACYQRNRRAGRLKRFPRRDQ